MSSSRGGRGAKAFIQAKRNVNAKSSSIFNPDSGEGDLSDNLVKLARSTGILNLANRNLQKIPLRVWRMHIFDEKDKSSSSVSLDNPSEQKWWEFVELQKLILANNCIRQIPPDINQLSSLQTLDAHDNQLNSVAPEIGQLGELSKLDLSHNKLKDIPVDIYNLKLLFELRLNNNELESISKEIGQLGNLKVLDVSFNNLTTLPEDIGFLSFLTTVNVSNNKLEEIPHDFCGLTGLREFDASENMLSTVPSSFSDLIHLEILRLQNNKFEGITGLGCPNLKELYLNNNRVKEFSSETFASTRIEFIDLRNNKIGNLVVNKEDLEFVSRLYLENNDILTLPDDLALLPSLKHLSLEGNPLRGIRIDVLKRGTQGIIRYLRSRINTSTSEKHGSDINNSTSDISTRGSSPRSVTSQEELGLDPYKLKSTKALSLVDRKIKSIEDKVFILAADANVNKVDLSRNLLSSLPPTFDSMNNFLNELNLGFNQFTSLPACIGTFVNLQFLNFQNNQIDQVPAELARLTKLREINFGYNKFSEIPSCLYDLPSLEILIATNNKISQLDVTKLAKLSALAALDLRNNDISQVPPELGLLTQLRSLNIEGNAFRVPGYAVLSKGTEAVLNFLRNRIPQK